MVMTFCACGSQSPTDVADTFLAAIKAQDSDAIKSVYADGALDLLGETEEESEEVLGDDFSDELEQELINKILEFDYEISNEQINGDTATVDVAISTYDFGSAMAEFASEYITQGLVLAFSGASDDEMNELANTLFEEQLEKAEKDYTGTTTLSLTKTDDGWTVDEIDEGGVFVDVLFGGLINSLENLEDSFSEDE